MMGCLSKLWTVSDVVRSMCAFLSVVVSSFMGSVVNVTSVENLDLEVFIMLLSEDLLVVSPDVGSAV
jgi:hypothetical protein